MRIIAFVTQKGGAGKSTLTVNCAVAARSRNRKALILDLDPQGSSEAWYQDREDEAPRLARIDSWSLPEAIAAAESAGFDYVLIDTPGRDEPSVTAAIRAADFCVIPCRPTPVDLKAVPPTVATIHRLEKPAAFVLTQTQPRGDRVREAEVSLGMLGLVCPIRVVSRTAYQDAQGSGLGVMEYEPEGKAATEIRQLWDWIVKKMEKTTHDQKTHVA